MADDAEDSHAPRVLSELPEGWHGQMRGLRGLANSRGWRDALNHLAHVQGHRTSQVTSQKWENIQMIPKLGPSGKDEIADD